QKAIREAREGLTHLLETGDLCGSPRNQMTVVFDGQPGIFYPKRTSNVKVIFSVDETADDLIKRLVEKAGSKKSLYVITDDKALGQSVRDLGAKTLSVKDFFGRTDQTKKMALKAKKFLEGKNISTMMEFKINDELKKIWLKK
ncbi:MAG: NYN domain-containing protein, partial [Candidatus Omnitrophica bacterium]|nr:NYN domain-containing protein [Candidatus Omnitrophota bacterium]